MRGFLDIVVEEVLAEYEPNISDYTFVLPGKRAALLFRNKLLGGIRHTCWEPKFITLTSLISQISSLEIANDIVLLSRLYAVCKEQLGDDFNDSFENFFSWGEILLQDFAGIDNNLVDADKIILNLQDLQELDNRFHDDDIEESTKQTLEPFVKANNSYKHEFEKIWYKLSDIYHSFTTSLKSDGIGYSGMVCREAASQESLPNEKYIFIGFNTFNKAELQLITNLKPEIIFWDETNFFDSKEINNAFNPNSDIGISNIHSIKEVKISPSKEIKRNIEIIKCPSDFAQCKVVMNRLNAIPDIGDDTAIVLADDALMPIMLQSIPDSISSFNITTGLPILSSSAYIFYKILESIILDQKDGKFRQNSVTNILFHPILQELWKDDRQISVLKQNIDNNRYQYIDVSEIENVYFRQIFKKKTDPDFSIGSYFIECLSYYAKCSHSIETTEMVLRMHKSIETLSVIIKRYYLDISNSIFIRILNRSFSGDYTPYETDALNGIQITGILETRCQDFKTVFLLSANDDKLPKKSQLLSFIPMNIREHFNLPTSGDFQRMTSSYFYHIISRAENVFILYNGDNSGMRTGEESRFVHQLKFFKPENTNLKYTFISSAIQNTEVESSDIHHSGETSRIISNSLLSASALNMYLSCQKKYALRYIKKIKESDSVSKNFKATDIGTTTHWILEEIGRDKYCKQKAIQLLGNFDSYVEPILNKGYEKIIKDYPHLEDSTDFNRLKKTIRMWVRNVLEYDASHEEFRTLEVEKNITHTFHLSDGRQVQFTMIIDRLDEVKIGCESVKRIIDYKTSELDGLEIPDKIEEIFSESTRKKYNPLIQTLLYSLPFDKVIPSIYSLGHLSNVEYSPYINGFKPLEYNLISKFSSELENCISELLDSDPNHIFNECDLKSGNCNFCDFKTICGK